MPWIAVIAAAGKKQGSGHLLRMSYLCKELNLRYRSSYLSHNKNEQKRRTEFNILFYKIESQETEKKTLNEIIRWKHSLNLIIMDGGDLDPFPFLQAGIPMIVLDNRHENRKILESSYSKDIDFHDTLPHSNVELKLVLQNALISPILMELIRNVAFPSLPVAQERAQDIVVYVGEFRKLRYLEAFLWSLREEQKIERVLWWGTEPEDRRLLKFTLLQNRVEQKDFYERIISQEVHAVFCYTGMLLLESLFVGKVPILFHTGSQKHDQIAKFLSQELGLNYIPKTSASLLENWSRKKDLLLDTSLFCRPSGKGWDILFEKIKDRIFR